MVLISRCRQIARSLARRPSFTIPAVLTLTLGIGSTTAVFSVVYATLLRPLPYADAARLVRVWGSDVHSNEPRAGVSLPDFRDWTAQNRSFEAMAAFQPAEGSLSDPNTSATRIREAFVSWDFFPTLGVAAQAGRTFSAADDRIGADRVVIISHEMWTARYGRGGSAIGSTLIIDGAPATIVGVLPDGIVFPRNTDVWLPLEPNTKTMMRDRGIRALGVIARLRPGATAVSAQRDMNGITARLEKAFPADNAGRGAFVEPLRDAVVGPTRNLVTILFSAVLLLLVLCCANVAALVVVRLGQRQPEIAIRFALGASRKALLADAIAESLFTGLAGAGAGVLTAWAAVGALLRLAPDSLPMKNAIALNAPVVAFAVAVSILTSVAAAVLPLLRGSGTMAQSIVRPAGRTIARSQSRTTRRLLVIGELALAAVLTSGALLLIRSYANLAAVSPGVAHLDVITAEIQLPDAKYPRPDGKIYPRWPQATRAYDELIANVERLPGITSAALAMNHPLRAGWTTGGVSVPGRPASGGPPDQFYIRAITAGYAGTVGLQLLAGRDIAAPDRIDGEPVVVVNQALAEKYFDGANPVGRSIVLWGTARRIVGVFANERFLGLQEGSAPALYPPLQQVPSSTLDIVVRSRRPLAQTMADVRGAVAAVDRDISVSRPATLNGLVAESLAPQRFTTVLLSVFGAIALVLAAVGVFGLVAYQVSLRFRELGIRAALGAERSGLVLLIVREAAALSAVAVGIGVIAALSLARFLDRFLFGIAPFDPATFAVSALALVLVGVGAAAVPAIRGSRVDPMTVLRAE